MIADNVIKDECIKRMKILELDSKIINDFKSDDKIYVSDLANDNIADVIVYPLLKIKILKFEKAKKVKIYHIVHTESQNKDGTYLLYVSHNKENWKNENRDMKLGYIEAYAYEEIREQKIIGIEINDGKIVNVNNM